MKHGLWLIFATLLGGILSTNSAVFAEEPESATEVAVHTGKVIKTALHRFISAYGIVEPEAARGGKSSASAKIAAPMAGLLTQIHCEEGQQVKKGDLLFELDTRSSDALIAKAEVTVEFAQKNFARKQQLKTTDNVSRKLYDEAEQLLQTARKDLLNAKTQRDLLQIKAPLSGTVAIIHFKVGEAVNLATVLADLIDLNRLNIAIRVPNGVNAVLLNIYSQPDGSTLDIANQLKQELEVLKKALPPDMQATVFYDQSLLVGDSIQSVWEAIILGLILSIAILYVFLKNWGATLIAAVVIPATVLMTLLVLRVMGLGFNLMTLGGIAAAIGLIIDDAIVVVEAVHAKISTGARRLAAVQQAVAEIFRPLLASTLTPVVVFIPLAFLDGVAGSFFQALALTMVVSLLTSLILAVSLIPSLAAWWMPDFTHLASQPAEIDTDSSPADRSSWLERLITIYEKVLRAALKQAGKVLVGCALILAVGVWLYGRLESEFLPFMDEGGFVIDYHAPWGTSLSETDRQLRQAETLLRAIPELEGYSRRTGARLALGISQAHKGDFLVKLKTKRQRKTDEVVAELRQQLNAAVPGLHWEFAGILGDLIGDLTWSPRPIEIKLFSTDVEWLKQKAPQIEAELSKVQGVVDSFDGLETTGPSLSLRVRYSDAQRFGLTVNDVALAVSTAMLGQKASYVLEGDRVVNIRVRMNADTTGQIANLRELQLRSLDGRTVKLSQVADVVTEAGQLELHREDLRQLVAVSARLENRDLGSAIAEIKAKLSQDQTLPPGVLEFGGLFQQQQESFHNLLIVLLASVFLVFSVLLIEFRSFYEPIAIVFGSLLALCGTVMAWYLTGTSVNIVSLLGAIIGIGVVAKNGILMLDSVHRFESQGKHLADALAESGRRRLRPVLMTSLAAALGLLPLAYGIGAGSDMLKPLAIAVIGALTLSVLLSLVATPTVYFVMRTSLGKKSWKLTFKKHP